MLNKLNVSGSNCLVVTGLVRDADVIIRESILDHELCYINFAFFSLGLLKIEIRVCIY